jgi:hypothetical protein
MWKTNSYASMVAAAVLKLADPFHNLGLCQCQQEAENPQGGDPFRVHFRNIHTSLTHGSIQKYTFFTMFQR